MASSNGVTKVWTGAITAAIVIASADGVVELSVLCSTGTCLITGAKSYFHGAAPSAITLAAGQSYNLRSANQGAPLDGITIEPVGGESQVMIAQG